MNSETAADTTAEIEVCHGPQCSDEGGRVLSRELEARGLKPCAGDCRSQCPNAPLVLVANRMITKATVEKVLARLNTLQD